VVVIDGRDEPLQAVPAGGQRVPVLATKLGWNRGAAE
jgi:hypothetical protein